MEQANIRVRLNKQGDDVPIVGCTPAEAVVLHVLHQNNNGGRTFADDIKNWEVKDVTEAKTVVTPADGKKPAVTRPRTDIEELNRLRAKYGHNVNKNAQKIVGLIWTDKINPKLPQKFSDLHWEAIQYDGLEVAPLNYTTGQPATATPPVPPAK